MGNSESIVRSFLLNSSSRVVEKIKRDGGLKGNIYRLADNLEIKVSILILIIEAISNEIKEIDYSIDKYNLYIWKRGSEDEEPNEREIKKWLSRIDKKVTEKYIRRRVEEAFREEDNDIIYTSYPDEFLRLPDRSNIKYDNYDLGDLVNVLGKEVKEYTYKRSQEDDEYYELKRFGEE